MPLGANAANAARACAEAVGRTTEADGQKSRAGGQAFMVSGCGSFANMGCGSISEVEYTKKEQKQNHLGMAVDPP